MPRYLKFILPFLVLFAIIAYSLSLKNNIDKMSQNSDQVLSGSVLKDLPGFVANSLDGQQVSSTTFNKDASAFYVHIWGTWCGPCETEFGDILKFAESVKDKKVLFYLIAVNDEVQNINKFLKRYKSIPSNVKILIDQNNQVMDKFGTYKVPETFLFSSSAQNKNKYVGPQEWLKPLYLTQLGNLLENH